MESKKEERKGNFQYKSNCRFNTILNFLHMTQTNVIRNQNNSRMHDTLKKFSHSLSMLLL